MSSLVSSSHIHSTHSPSDIGGMGLLPHTRHELIHWLNSDPMHQEKVSRIQGCLLQDGLLLQMPSSSTGWDQYILYIVYKTDRQRSFISNCSSTLQIPSCLKLNLDVPCRRVTQVLEASPCASRGTHEQKAGIGSIAGLKLQCMMFGHKFVRVVHSTQNTGICHNI